MLNNNPIGILIDNFHLDTYSALQKAYELGANGIQFYAKNDMSPQSLTGSKRKEFLNKIEDYGMTISAICGDVGGFVFSDKIPDNIEQTKRIIDMSLEMGNKIITGHIGAIPMCPAHPRYKLMLESLDEIGSYADKVGAYYAIETGPETSAVLLSFIEELNHNSIRVNMDPANIVMISGENPAKAVLRLKDKIVHTHMKDGVMNWYCDPEIAYGNIPDVNNIKPGHRDQKPLGEGNVPWNDFFKALDSIGYNGFLTIEREGGEDRCLEISNAMKFLKKELNR